MGGRPAARRNKSGHVALLARVGSLLLIGAMTLYLARGPPDYYSDPKRQADDSSSSSSSGTSPTRNRLIQSLETTPVGALGPKGTNREHLIYYDSLYFLALQYGRQAKSLLEVGCAKDPFAQYLSWIDQRTCVAPYQVDYGNNTKKQATSKTVDFVKADFLEYPVPKKYDLVVCSQVVEHVPDPAAFMKKLIQSAHTSIISVPYKWAPCGEKCGHLSHNIDLDTIMEWSAPAKPKHHTVITEKKVGRIIVVFSDQEGNPTESMT